MVRRTGILVGLLMWLVACAGPANHLGNPLLLPGAAISAGLENARYDSRRNKVKRFVTSHQDAIHSEILGGKGDRLYQAMALAGVPDGERSRLKIRLHSNSELYVQPNIEPLVVALMVHGA